MKNYIYILSLLTFLGFTAVSQAEIVYIHNDALGSPIMETNELGTVISRTHYKPFGETLEQMKEGVGYTGHLNDADLGLTYMQARYYDPVIGRFYSNDPVGFTGEIDTFNRYSYVANNPYKYTDPTGEEKYSIGVTAEAMLIAGVRISLSASIDTDNLEIGAAVSAGPRLGLGVGIGGAYDVTQSETGAAKTETKDGGVSVTADGQIGPLSLGGEIMSDATLSGQNSTTAGTSDGNDKTSNLKGKLGIAGSIGVEFKGEATSSALADTVAEVKSWL